MGIGRVANAISSYVWFNTLYVVLILVFAAGFQPLVGETLWVDRVWYLFLVIPFSGVATLVSFGRRQHPDWDGEWWGRTIHAFVSFLIILFLTVLFLAYLLPNYVSRNCQPDGLGVVGLCEGGRCDNPFNSPAWFCLYNHTNEAQSCNFWPVIARDLCSVSHNPLELDSAFAHLWLMAFVVVFIVMGSISLVLMYNIHRISLEMRLLSLRDLEDPDATRDGYRAPVSAGVKRVSESIPVIPVVGYTSPFV